MSTIDDVLRDGLLSPDSSVAQKGAFSVAMMLVANKAIDGRGNDEAKDIMQERTILADALLQQVDYIAGSIAAITGLAHGVINDDIDIALETRKALPFAIMVIAREVYALARTRIDERMLHEDMETQIQIAGSIAAEHAIEFVGMCADTGIFNPLQFNSLAGLAHFAKAEAKYDAGVACGEELSNNIYAEALLLPASMFVAASDTEAEQLRARLEMKGAAGMVNDVIALTLCAYRYAKTWGSAMELFSKQVRRESYAALMMERIVRSSDVDGSREIAEFIIQTANLWKDGLEQLVVRSSETVHKSSPMGSAGATEILNTLAASVTLRESIVSIAYGMDASEYLDVVEGIEFGDGGEKRPIFKEAIYYEELPAVLEQAYGKDAIGLLFSSIDATHGKVVESGAMDKLREYLGYSVDAILEIQGGWLTPEFDKDKKRGVVANVKAIAKDKEGKTFVRNIALFGVLLPFFAKPTGMGYTHPILSGVMTVLSSEDVEKFFGEKSDE